MILFSLILVVAGFVLLGKADHGARKRRYDRIESGKRKDRYRDQLANDARDELSAVPGALCILIGMIIFIVVVLS